MNVLVIHAHNEPKSFCSSMRDVCVSTFKQNSHCVQSSDLYELNWNPVATKNDFNKLNNEEYLIYALEQRHGFLNNSLSADIAQEIEKVLWADLLIFSFPLYWFSVPAIMKGWFDRVLLSGLCYGGKKFYSNGGLTGKKAALIFTTGGRKDMLSENGVHGDIMAMLKPIMQGTLAYTGMSVLPYFIAHHVPYVEDEKRKELLHKLRQYVKNIEGLAPINFVDLVKFDDDFKPR